MATLFFAIGVSILVCMIHAAVTKRWELVRGGAPLLTVATLLALIASFT
jgi:hypothetical protein